MDLKEIREYSKCLGYLSYVYYVDSLMRKQGMCISFYSTGDLSFQEHYKNGLLHGFYRDYYLFGKNERIGFHKIGFQFGEHISHSSIIKRLTINDFGVNMKPL